MIAPQVTKKGEFQFEILYEGHEPLNLDFKPLHLEAQRLHPCKRYVLKHWQARPRGERRFGEFSYSQDDTLYSCHVEAIASSAFHYDLQIPEGVTIPSAVLFYPNAIERGGKVILDVGGSTAFWPKSVKVGA